MKQTAITEKWLQIASRVLAVLTAVVAAAFIVQTLHIYFYGVSAANQPAPGVYLEPIYSVKTISAHFAPIAPLVYGYIVCIAGLMIARAIIPANKEKPVTDGLKQWREREIARQQKSVPQWAAYLGLAIAVALIVWGCFNGSARDVFVRAVNICTECVGLG